MSCLLVFFGGFGVGILLSEAGLWVDEAGKAVIKARGHILREAS